MYMCIHVRMHAYADVCVVSVCLSVCTSVCLFVHLCVYVCMRVCVCVCVCVCKCKCKCVCYMSGVTCELILEHSVMVERQIQSVGDFFQNKVDQLVHQMHSCRLGEQIKSV